ncbi:hypothetical protein DBV15_04095 [Temnothorax longispinosus]|uniref:Uncharacterized protein n=1 Tax=Temnothorax longispinosus TaxID=300112 RepID=A0A4S2KDM3_9HYME|nr:hypothetical protein DBV15_04095 [Temnothorax longispinosus]
MTSSRLGAGPSSTTATYLVRAAVSFGLNQSSQRRILQQVHLSFDLLKPKVELHQGTCFLGQLFGNVVLLEVLRQQSLVRLLADDSVIHVEEQSDPTLQVLLHPIDVVVLVLVPRHPQVIVEETQAIHAMCRADYVQAVVRLLDGGVELDQRDLVLLGQVYVVLDGRDLHQGVQHGVVHPQDLHLDDGRIADTVILARDARYLPQRLPADRLDDELHVADPFRTDVRGGHYFPTRRQDVGVLLQPLGEGLVVEGVHVSEMMDVAFNCFHLPRYLHSISTSKPEAYQIFEEKVGDVEAIYSAICIVDNKLCQNNISVGDTNEPTIINVLTYLNTYSGINNEHDSKPDKTLCAKHIRMNLI